MWHPTDFVAESRRVDSTALTAFALANKDKYGILVGQSYAEVSTWHVDDLVKDFRNHDPLSIHGLNHGKYGRPGIRCRSSAGGSSRRV